MALIEQNAPLRDRVSFAHWFQKLSILKRKTRRQPCTISDHLARDIGLKPHEVERINLRLPSQTRTDL